MRRLLFILLAAMLLSACGTPDSPTAAGTPAVDSTAIGATAAPTITPPDESAPPTATPADETASSPATSIPTAPTATQEATPMPQPTERGGGSLRPAPDTTQVKPEQPTLPAGVTIAPPYTTGIQQLIDQAAADLASRLNVATSAIEVTEVRSVIWPDMSLGCPQPGMGYKQVPVDGILIQLRAGGQLYNYHGGGRREPFLCLQAQTGSAPAEQSGDLSR